MTKESPIPPVFKWLSLQLCQLPSTAQMFVTVNIEPAWPVFGCNLRFEDAANSVPESPQRA